MTKEDIKQICQIYDNLRVERNTATIAYNSDDAFYEHILATYKLSQSSLPSNIDEAANRQAALEPPYKWEEEQDDSFGVTPLFVMSNIRSAFKAGAEWMAEQGINAESEVCKLAERAWVTPIDEKQLQRDLCDNFVAGDKVIVQIHKK